MLCGISRLSNVTIFIFYAALHANLIRNKRAKAKMMEIKAYKAKSQVLLSRSYVEPKWQLYFPKQENEKSSGLILVRGHAGPLQLGAYSQKATFPRWK